jgi:putative transposase
VLVAYRPHVDVSLIVQWLKGISSRILLQELRTYGRSFGTATCGPRVSCRQHGNLTDEMVQEYMSSKKESPFTTTVDL